MTILPLVTALNGGLSALTTPTGKYNFTNHTQEETNQLSKDMIESMYHYNGLGISANQLGLPWSVFALRGVEADFICFNPRLVMPSTEEVELEEACLSFPGLAFKIKRPRHIRLRFTDAQGQMDTFNWANLTARIVLHEFDHLIGKVFFAGIPRPSLERVIRQAKKRGFDYTGLGLMKYAGKKEEYNA